MIDTTGSHAVRLATHAMGTRFELLLAGGDEELLRAAGEEVIELIEDAHRRLTRFERGSVVSEINAAAGVGAVRADNEVFDLLSRCERYRVDSGGAFDVVFSSPVANGGGAERSEAEGVPPRSSAATGEDPLRPASGRPPPQSVTGEENVNQRLVLDRPRRQVMLLQGGSFVDLGGVAKGFALDLAVGALRAAGVGSALLHGGSSTIVAIGGPPDADAWSVAFADDGRSPVARLRDLALSVSSQRGDRPDHVIDPATGRPARAAAWAACLGPSAEATDAWSTALVVLGRRSDACPTGLTTVLRPPSGTTLPGRAGWDVRGPDANALHWPHDGET